MKLFRNFASVSLGLLAGAAAYALIKKYDSKTTMEGDYVLVNEPEDAPAPEAEAPAQPAARTVETTLSDEDALWDLPTAEDVFANRGQSTGANVNPVELGAAEKPPVVDGKIDATKIADPNDFNDWDSFGCQG